MVELKVHKGMREAFPALFWKLTFSIFGLKFLIQNAVLRISAKKNTKISGPFCVFNEVFIKAS